MENRKNNSGEWEFESLPIDAFGDYYDLEPGQTPAECLEDKDQWMGEDLEPWEKIGAICDTLSVCRSFGIPVPIWLLNELMGPLEAVVNLDACGLDQAFGITPRTTREMNTLKTKRDVYTSIEVDITVQHKIYGRKLNPDFWEDIGEKHNKSAETIKGIWYRSLKGWKRPK